MTDSSLPTLSSRRRARRGFALLITITLLAFVVLLVVGLATYTRVETAIAGNTQKQAQARQNALLALDVALGQLQKSAGPDQRVTATADAFANKLGTAHYTGVWDTTATGSTPVTWLVSGNEFLNADGTPNLLAARPDNAPTLSDTNSAALVGSNSSGVTNDVRALLQPIKPYGVPGQSANDTPTIGGTTIGRYAWWVGDQGVKASVGLGDKTTVAANFDYAPFASSSELRNRLRQQTALGAGPSAVAGAAVFEPRDTNGAPSNSTLAANILTDAQLSFFHPSGSVTGALGLPAVRSNFFSWSAGNANVLANTDPLFGGLRSDLSLKPDLLGSAFAAWANYEPSRGGSMEDITAPATPAPLDPYSTDPVRRRYRITTEVVDGGIEHHIAPVVSFFGISFSLRNDTTNNSPTMLEASARCVVGLWNPYSSALVPENLELVVTGLPTVAVSSAGAPTRMVPLQTVMANSSGDVKFALPFSPDGINPDRSSWLPGRVYNWSAPSSTAVPGAAGYAMTFYVRDATLGIGGIVRDAGPPLGPNTILGVQNYRICSDTESRALTIELRRASDGATLARFTSPRFDPFPTSSPQTVGGTASDFAYVFRLPDRAELPARETQLWLQADGRDPRERNFPSPGHEGFIVPGQDPQPPLLVTPSNSGFPATYSKLLLDRYPGGTGRDFNEDAPLFELPRSPLLSLGSLQHLFVPGVRPFSVGNSWGGARNAWFDRYFFSGLTPDVAWSDVTKPLPNSLLQVLRSKSDGSAVTVSDLAGSNRRSDGYSAKFLLQKGSFNLNSTSLAAWTAVLRNVRFNSSTDFTFADVSSSSGTSGDSTSVLSEPALSLSRVAMFPRFAQTAQETFKAVDDYIQSDTGTPSNVVNTSLFRRGIRVLSATQVANLAENIVALIRQKHASGVPFQTVQEFLAPTYKNSSGDAVSLFEKAIEDAQLNTDGALGLTVTSVEFSSQFLTQGDIMTALAPVLFARSDTFVIRTYGEAVNPATSATEGRAWCEAIVQRVPEYFDAAADPAETAPAALTSELNKTYGRRFKVVSFRWLTRSDL